MRHALTNEGLIVHLRTALLQHKTSNNNVFIKLIASNKRLDPDIDWSFGIEEIC